MSSVHLVVLVMLLFCIGCSTKKSLTPDELKAYESEVDSWHATRIQRVKAPDGWLNLVGLYWLDPGMTSFGSSPESGIVFPEGKIAANAGYFIVHNNTVTVVAADGVRILLNDKPIAKEIIYHPDSVKAAVLTCGSLEWSIIKRDNMLGIRLRDHDSENLKTFTGVERFPTDPAYRVTATFEESPDSAHTIAITNVLGQTTQQSSPGTLVFNLQGKAHRLDVLEGNAEEFFIVFGDATSGKETYGGGRFIYVRKPDEAGTTSVDFNKAYNPPCVFTPYATCPLPPKQNELTIEVKAGEKNYSLETTTGKATAAIQ